MQESEIFFEDELQMLGYGESDSHGAWIKFRLRDPEQLALFRNQPSGSKQGKRFACVLVEIDDNEEPKQQQRSLSQQAYLMTTHSNYFRFSMCDRLTIQQMMEKGWNPNTEKGRQQYCNAHLKWWLGITSKRDLDHNQEKANKFMKLQKMYADFVAKMNDHGNTLIRF